MEVEPTPTLAERIRAVARASEAFYPNRVGTVVAEGKEERLTASGRFSKRD